MPKQAVDIPELFGVALPNIFELTSNEYNFKERSSYAFDLNADASKLKWIFSTPTEKNILSFVLSYSIIRSINFLLIVIILDQTNI